MRSVVDRNVVMRRMTANQIIALDLFHLQIFVLNCKISEIPLGLAVQYTDMRRLTTGIRSEKYIVRRFRRCAKVIDCTYTNLDSTV